MPDQNDSAQPAPRPRGTKPRPDVGQPAVDAPTAPILRDLLTDNPETLMGEVFDFAFDGFADARSEPLERVRRRRVQQAMGLTQGYARLIEARDRHLKAIRR